MLTGRRVLVQAVGEDPVRAAVAGDEQRVDEHERGAAGGEHRAQVGEAEGAQPGLDARLGGLVAEAFLDERAQLPFLLALQALGEQRVPATTVVAVRHSASSRARVDSAMSQQRASSITSEAAPQVKSVVCRM